MRMLLNACSKSVGVKCHCKLFRNQMDHYRITRVFMVQAIGLVQQSRLFKTYTGRQGQR